MERGTGFARRTLSAWLLAGCTAAMLAAGAPPPAVAQDQPVVTLRLRSQTPWTSPRRPLRIQVEVTNAGVIPLDGLSLAIITHAEPAGRIAYEESLESDPDSPIDVDLRAVAGTLAPGQTRTLSVASTLTFLREQGQPTGLYPMKIEVRSNDVEVGALRTPLVYYVREPEEVPLNVTATFVIAEPLHRLPNGVYPDEALERSIAPNGDLATRVELLREADLPITLVVSPVLLDQLTDMADGYEVGAGDAVRTVPSGQDGAQDAARLLEGLRELAGREDVDLAAYPYGAASLPALAGSALRPDVAIQMERGAAALELALGRPPVEGLVRPPDGGVDATTLHALREVLSPTILLDPGDAIPPEEPNELNPVGTGRLEISGGDDVPAILPNSLVEAMIERFPEDPVLGAQAVIGELVAIYRELPATNRGVALSFGEDAHPDPAFLGPLFEGLGTLPLLDPQEATSFLQALDDVATLELVRQAPDRFSATYEAGIVAARVRIAQLGSVIAAPSRLPARLSSTVLLAEGPQFLEDEAAGAALVRSVTDLIHEEFRKLVPPREGTIFTLASRNGRIPLTIQNESELPARVRVALHSPALGFSLSRSKVVALDPGFNRIDFQVQARRGGRFPVDVVLCAPSAASCTPDSDEALRSSQIIIRSTVYNRVALVITIGAALFLLVWWGRRFVPRHAT